MRWHLWDPRIQPAGPDSGEVLGFLPHKQMQINNFSACVFIRQAFPSDGGWREGAMHMENRYVNSFFHKPLGNMRTEQRSARLKIMYNHKRSSKCMKESHLTTGLAGEGWQRQQAPIIHLCLHFPRRNNKFPAKYAVAGHYLVIPVDKEAISAPTL